MDRISIGEYEHDVRLWYVWRLVGHRHGHDGPLLDRHHSVVTWNVHL